MFEQVGITYLHIVNVSDNLFYMNKVGITL